MTRNIFSFTNVVIIQSKLSNINIQSLTVIVAIIIILIIIIINNCQSYNTFYICLIYYSLQSGEPEPLKVQPSENMSVPEQGACIFYYEYIEIQIHVFV